MLDKIWIEKFRPREIKHLVGNENLKKSLQTFLDKGEIPNIMLFGPPGTGKTTIGKILVNTLDCEYLFINGSDENNVDMVRNKIGTYGSSVSFAKFRIIFIDEFDFLSTSSQAVLRNMIESFYDNTRFIVTCNYPKKIIDALHSRFQAYEVKPPNIDDIEIRMKKILDKEKIEYEEKDVNDLVKNCYPDIRKTINSLQRFCIDDKLNVEQSQILSDAYKSEIISMIKKNESFEAIRQLIINSSTLEYSLMFKMLFDCIDDYCNVKEKKSTMLLDIAEHLYRDSFVLDKEINLSACILKLLKNNNNNK